MNYEINEPTVKEIEEEYGISIDEYPRYIEVFDKKTEFRVKKISVKIPLHDLQKIFRKSEENSMVLLPYDILVNEASALQKYVDEKLDLSKYDYEICAYPPK